MRGLIALVVFFTISLIFTNGRASEMGPNRETIYGYTPPDANDVRIAFSGVHMPQGRILLIHKDKEYCALKFIQCWVEKEGKERFATYEVYHQGDGTGDFSNKNVKVTQGKASLLRPRGPFYPLLWQPGNPEVECGSLKLAWDYSGFVCFFGRYQSPGEYGIKLAPTPWTDISQVNVLDPRLKWYGYDRQRKSIDIPIDKLFEGGDDSH